MKRLIFYLGMGTWAGLNLLLLAAFASVNWSQTEVPQHLGLILTLLSSAGLMLYVWDIKDSSN